VLRHNITSHFEKVRDNTFKQVFEGVAQSKLKPGIQVTIQEQPLRTPFADCNARTIHLDENYIAYLWAMSYSLFVTYEEGVKKRIISEHFTGIINYDTDLLKRAKLLFDWAVSLKDTFSKWDLNLPNPEHHNNDTERWYAEKVNGIFQDIVIYDLFHEFAHLFNDHCNALTGIFGKKTYALTEEDITLCKQIETEADNYAFDSIVETSDSEQYKLHKGVAIILAHCTSLFVLKNPNSVKQSIHPDIDNRILNSITRLNLKDYSSADYIWYFGALCCKFFFDKHSIATDASPADTTKDLFFRYLDKFDEIKKE
jgi:hypothetical protein